MELTNQTEHLRILSPTVGKLYHPRRGREVVGLENRVEGLSDSCVRFGPSRGLDKVSHLLPRVFLWLVHHAGVRRLEGGGLPSAISQRRGQFLFGPRPHQRLKRGDGLEEVDYLRDRPEAAESPEIVGEGDGNFWFVVRVLVHVGPLLVQAPGKLPIGMRLNRKRFVYGQHFEEERQLRLRGEFLAQDARCTLQHVLQRNLPLQMVGLPDHGRAAGVVTHPELCVLFRPRAVVLASVIGAELADDAYLPRFPPIVMLRVRLQHEVLDPQPLNELDTKLEAHSLFLLGRVPATAVGERVRMQQPQCLCD
mmetsp:Transcript_18903/g.52047  ORF Transcript_18903/g.52047 Transcript_18903/m.52047 type:complete len:308 (-) Transcript_18903:310-1233(-)